MAGGPEGGRPHFERTPQQSKPTEQPRQPEQTQPRQGKAEGRQNPQRPKTVDGHSTLAFINDPVIFKDRSYNGLGRLDFKIKLAEIAATRTAERYQEEAARPDPENANADRLRFLRERAIRRKAYVDGLNHAFNVFLDSLHGKRIPEPLGGLRRDDEPKK